MRAVPRHSALGRHDTTTPHTRRTHAHNLPRSLPRFLHPRAAGAGAMMVLFFGLMCAYKSSKDMTIKMYNDLKKEGAVGKV